MESACRRKPGTAARIHPQCDWRERTRRRTEYQPPGTGNRFRGKNSSSRSTTRHRHRTESAGEREKCCFAQDWIDNRRLRQCSVLHHASFCRPGVRGSRECRSAKRFHHGQDRFCSERSRTLRNHRETIPGLRPENRCWINHHLRSAPVKILNTEEKRKQGTIKFSARFPSCPSWLELLLFSSQSVLRVLCVLRGS